MADIDVSLKFEYSADPSDIRSQIEAAIKTISANPPKVKVTADITEAKKNLDALQKQITALTKQKVTLNIGAGAGGSNAKPKDLVKDTVAYNNALAALNNAMTQTRNKMKNWSAAATGNSSSAYNSLNTQIKAMEDLENRIKSGGVSVKDFAKEFSEIKASVAQASNEVAKFQENTKATSVSVEDQTRAYKKLFSMFSDIDKIKSKWSTKAGVSNTDEYKNILGNEEALQKLYEGYKDGSKTFEQFREGLVNIESDLAKNKANLAETGQAFGNFGSGIMQAAQQIGTFLVSYRMVMMAFQNIKKMIAASIEIESSMNRIQIVTGATDSQMTQFFETAASHAKELGTSISEVAGSIEVFSRLGYNLEDASGLAKYATIMSNVADTSVDSATSGLTSIIKGYGMDVKEAEHVTDVLVEVGQKYAISAEELMQAFERGGASMAASNTSFEKTAALFAATNASLQNAAKTGGTTCRVA